jgi:hypothetical protein
MPTLPSASDIRDVVAKEDDFGHEMRVGHVIRSIGSIQMQHGGTYIDSITSKPRQFDYRCSFQKDAQVLSLPVECKNLSPLAPLVVCGTKRRQDESFHEFIKSHTAFVESGKAKVFRGSSSWTWRANGQDSIYPVDGFVGKSLVRIRPDKNSFMSAPDSDIYDKWAQALSSAVDLVKLAPYLSRDLGINKPAFCAILPVVVVPDKVLWKVAYDDDGRIIGEPQQITDCTLYVARKITTGWSPPEQTFTFSHIHFFTLSGFSSFLSKMSMNEHAWAALFSIKAVKL